MHKPASTRHRLRTANRRPEGPGPELARTQAGAQREGGKSAHKLARYRAWEGLGSSTAARRNVPARAPAKEKKQAAAWLRLACKSASERTERARGGRAVESERAHCPSERARASERARGGVRACSQSRHGILCTQAPDTACAPQTAGQRGQGQS